MYRFFGMVFFIVACFLPVASKAMLSGSLDEKAILNRIKPVGQVTVQGGSEKAQAQNAPAPAVADIAQNRYEQTCKMCHETGLAGAPKFGDKAEWAPRIAEGIDVLVKHALEGYKAMPPKGGCMTCDENEIRKTVEYMVSHSK